MRHRHPSDTRHGFSAIELLVVIGIMMLLMAMASPAVLKSLRKGKVNSAASDVMQIWRQARMLAMSRQMPDAPRGTAPSHYGLMLVQDSGARSYAALIYDNRDQAALQATPETAVLRRDPTSGITSDSANPPVAKLHFNRNVVLASAADAAAEPDTADRVLVVYAQYRTGLPIEPAQVAAGKGPNAPAIGVGLAGNPEFGIAASPISAKLRLQTLDYASTPSKRGHAIGVTLYPVGVLAAQEL